MKKFLQNIVARALCVLALGILLIVFSESITLWMVMLCGVVFIIPGLVSIVSYFRRDPEGDRVMLYPVVGAGSILFGLVLLIWPALFVEAMMYILSVILILVAASQFYTLWNIHRGVKVHFAYYLVPALELAAGLYILLGKDTLTIASLPIILLGCGFIIYAALELWTVYLIRTASKQQSPLIQAEEVEEAE
ncbi:MAG: DUF308 domain-containing protein [Bacteroidales bacterium]|nr:DUF308 domain-containing protein [Bacteroidales bacterium]